MIQLDESRDTRAAKGAGLKLRCVVLRRFESCSLHQMSKRIDIEAYTQIFEADDGITDEQLVAFGLSAIAELKRCYEQMDWLHQVADLATDYIGEIHHSHWDIFEERMFAAGLWERPSE